MTGTCRRLRQDGVPCAHPVARKHDDFWGTYEACWSHLTSAEKQDHRERKQRDTELWEALRADRPTRPAAWSWDVPIDLFNDSNPLMALHESRGAACGMCGSTRGRLVLDHDHETGWQRGYICRGCNIHEGTSLTVSPVVRRWRKHPSAAMIGWWERYANPFHGEDFGVLNGRPVQTPHPVTRGGTVFIRPPRSLSEDLAHVVAEATWVG